MIDKVDLPIELWEQICIATGSLALARLALTSSKMYDFIKSIMQNQHNAYRILKSTFPKHVELENDVILLKTMRYSGELYGGKYFASQTNVYYFVPHHYNLNILSLYRNGAYSTFTFQIHDTFRFMFMQHVIKRCCNKGTWTICHVNKKLDCTHKCKTCITRPSSEKCY